MPLDPTDAEVISAAVESGLLDVHTGMPGIVEKYDASKQVCDVKPALSRVIKNPGEARKVESLPVIQNVRVQWPRAGDFWITMPLKKGDFVWLVFSEVSDNKFRETGEESEPDDLRRFSLGDASCYPYPGPDANVCPDASDTDMVIGKDGGAIITITDSGDICIGRGATEKIARADRVGTELQKLYDAMSAAVPAPTDGGAALKTSYLAALDSMLFPEDTGSDIGKVE